MSYSISVKKFNAAENNKVWEKIFNGTYLEDMEKEIPEIDIKLLELDKNPKIEVDYKLQNQEENLKNRKENLSDLKRDIGRLKSAIANNDDESIKEYIDFIDDSITENYNGKDYFYDSSRFQFHDFFSTLFKIILNLNISENYQDTLELLPTEKWIELYKKIDASAVKKAIAMVSENPNDIDEQKSYFDLTKEIRDIVKNCIDTNSEIQVSDELYGMNEEESINKNRTKEIINKFVKK